MAKGYSSPKLTQYIGDGFEYLQQHENEFDVVITDSSDPVGMYHHHHNLPFLESVPSKVLLQSRFRSESQITPKVWKLDTSDINFLKAQLSLDRPV